MWPRVRATLGSRSGPITTRATAAMSAISLNAMSNMLRFAQLQRLLFLHFAFDRLPGDLLRSVRRSTCGRRRIGAVGAFHAVLEAFHRAAEVLPDVTQLLGSEYKYDDQQYDQPVPDAQSTHGRSPLEPSWALSPWAAFYPAASV